MTTFPYMRILASSRCRQPIPCHDRKRAESACMAVQESLRVLAVLASPVCPLQEEVLRQPMLARITAFIRMQYRVRVMRRARKCRADDLHCGEPQVHHGQPLCRPGAQSHDLTLADLVSIHPHGPERI